MHRLTPGAGPALAAGLLALALLPACSRAPEQPATDTKVAETAPARQPEALPFIDDDYAKALSDATARKLPLFIDVWAPW